jgi:hypothetical protein
MIGQEKRGVGGWWMWILLLIAVSAIVFSFMGYAGMFTGTIVERAVFENSYQYSAARKGEIAVFTAQLAEINSTLMGANLSDAERSDLESQASALRVQLAAARSK